MDTQVLGRSERWAGFSDDELAVLMLALDALSARDGDFEQARERLLTEVTRQLRGRIRGAINA